MLGTLIALTHCNASMLILKALRNADTAWDLVPDAHFARSDMGLPRFVEELLQQGYPVVTTLTSRGISLVQATPAGVSLISKA